MAVTEQMNNEKAKKENLANDIKSYLERIKEIINKKIPDTLKKMRWKILAEGYNQMYFDIKGFSSPDDDPTGAFLLTPMWCDDDFAA